MKPARRELSPIARLGVFGAGLAVVLAAALGLGRATGDVGQAVPAAAAEHGGGHHAGHGSPGLAATAPATGTTLSADGLRLEVPTTLLPTLTRTTFRFRVLDEDGPVTGYDVEQGKQMHLVIVSRDLARHAHVHPQLSPDGTWHTPLTLAPGSYRAVADFSVAGRRRSLAVDLAVPGPLAPKPLPPAVPTSTLGDLTVSLERDGRTLSFTASRGGRPVVPEPYLGARGHLVAFRAGDLAYAHVHPSGEDGARTSYEAELPGPGRYRLFLELQVDGVVRAFPYTLDLAT